MSIEALLPLIAFILFVLAACGVRTGQLTAAGMACLALTLVSGL